MSAEIFAELYMTDYTIKHVRMTFKTWQNDFYFFFVKIQATSKIMIVIHLCNIL